MKFPVYKKCLGAKAGKGLSGRRQQIIGVLGLLLVAATLQACSAAKIAYNQAIELSFWQLDGYFDFNESQRPKIREELAKVHQWHRQTQLPVYIEMLQRWQSWVPGELTEAQACTAFDEVRGKLQAVSDRVIPSMGSVVVSLAPEQLEAMKRKFAKVNAEYRSDFLDGSTERLIDKRFKKALSRAEMLYGPLDEPQKSVLRNRITESVFDAKLSLAEYQRRQRDALQSLTPLIAGQATPDQARPVMRAYVQRALNSPDPTYRSYQDRLNRDSCQTFAALHNSTTPAQRAKAMQTLRSYEQDMAILTSQR